MRTITDEFDLYKGTKEYNGIVAVIQRWFYGSLVRDSWCATSVSFFADRLGILEQLGGKNENVFLMMEAARKAAAKSGEGVFLYQKDIPSGAVIRRGTILFLLHDGTVMKSTSRKHVTTAAADTRFRRAGNIACTGGNQNDEINTTAYEQKKIYGVFFPVYNGRNPRELAKSLYKNALGRAGEESGVNYWTVGFTTQTLTGANAAKDFFLGPEYAKRERSDAEFVRDLYRGLLQRQEDFAGFAYWLALLREDGETREEVVKGFWASNEYQRLCDLYGIAHGKW